MKRILNCLMMACFALAMIFAIKVPVNAASAGTVVYSSWNYPAGTYNSKGQIVFKPCTSDYNGIDYERINSNALQKLCSLSGSKTIVIPSGSTVKLQYSIYLTSNTTIIATGADIVQTTAGTGIFYNRATATSYGSIENVTINGGTWRTTSKTKACSLIAFNHGYDITIKNATITGNYQSHAIEFIADKKCVVEDCTIGVIGTKDADSIEEAIQIDVATPSTAPGIATEKEIGGVTCGGSKYVQGQTCKNIKIRDCSIKGSTGICTNYISSDAYKNKFHNNITITGCTIVGASSEGCRIYNATNVTIKDNKIKSNSTKTGTIRSIGLNIAFNGTSSSDTMADSELVVKDNKIYGWYRGLFLISNTSSKNKTATITGNTCYATKKADAVVIRDSIAKKITQSSNTSKKRDD